MAQWSVQDIPWDRFDASQVDPKLVPLIKAACMVEHNGHDYGRYLSEVFHDDDELKRDIAVWAEEEVKHGEALRRWAERADPTFDFEKSFALFTEGYKLPMNVDASVRGSRVGELVARCVVETGTSSYYTAIADATNEPALEAICRKIAADEFRHYKLFYTHLKTYLDKEKIGALRRLRIALSRIAESEDDELAYAFYAAHYDGTPYDYQLCMKRYQAGALAVYRRENLDRMTAMVWKAAGIKPYQWAQNLSAQLAWKLLTRKRASLAAYKMPVAAYAHPSEQRMAA